jgi:HEAT repeat protein
MAKNPSNQALIVFERALSSPHPEVRVAAIGTMPQSHAERALPQIERLLGDTESAVRREALRALVKMNATSVVPAITRRVQAPEFHELAILERREWMSSLWKLAQPRAEEVLIAIVSEKRLIPSEPAEETRAVAVDLLSAASSDEALKAARTAAKKWWWNSPDVRQAAARTVKAIEERKGLAPMVEEPEPPSSRGTP